MTISDDNSNNFEGTTTRRSSNAKTIDPSLVRQLVLATRKEAAAAAGGDQQRQQHSNNKRLSKDAEPVIGELLRLFILEARSRASIEAECESSFDGDDEKPLIKAEHITKIAAELLMEFS